MLNSQKSNSSLACLCGCHIVGEHNLLSLLVLRRICYTPCLWGPRHSFLLPSRNVWPCHSEYNVFFRVGPIFQGKACNTNLMLDSDLKRESKSSLLYLYLEIHFRCCINKYLWYSKCSKDNVDRVLHPSFPILKLYEGCNASYSFFKSSIPNHSHLCFKNVGPS